MRIIIALAIASALARSIGIIRWLVPMYDLADLWNGATTEEQRYTISTTFDALNSYGGTIGEILGVSIFAALAILLLSIGNMRQKTLPNWFSIFGLISAFGLLWTSTEIIGLNPGDSAIFLGTTLVQIWFLLTGIWLIARSKNLTANSAA